MKKIYSSILSAIFLLTILVSTSLAARPVSYDAISPKVTANEVAINATNFPDASFRFIVSRDRDSNQDGILSTAEASQITKFNLDNKSIQDLKGIEYFTALVSLDCGRNQLTTLDVSKNTALQTLYCDHNQLTTLDVSKNTALVSLDCGRNQLTTLDVSKNSALQTLRCGNNQLTKLDVSKNSALVSLSCGYNQLTKLDVSKNSTLQELWCIDNQLTTLDVSKNSALTLLECGGNPLTKLDVSKNSALQQLECGINQLTKLDVSKNTALTALYCFNSKLTKLDVSKNTALQFLYCYNNQLTALDVSKNTALLILYCWNNQLTKLDVSKNSALKYLYCYDNKLTTLDVSGCPNLTNNNIYCDSGVKIIRTQEDEPDEPTEETAPKITATSLQEGRVGVSYSKTLEASGTTPITWSAKGLPSGLKINKSTGEIYGSPKKAGSFDVTITAKNKVNKKNASDSVTLSLIINPALFTPKITTTSLKSGSTDKQYSVTLKASGTAPISWTSGTLPNGFTLDPETGELSGNTSEVWNSKITFFATNSVGTYSKDLKLTIKGVNPKINTKKIDKAFQDKSYSANLESIGTAPLTWSATGLPDGLNIDPSTGNISGTPEVSGKFNVKITLANPAKSVSKTFKLIVESYPEITTDSMKSGSINKSYNFTMKAKSVDTKKFAWFAIGLPNGLNMDINTGKISGIPTESGTFTVVIVASIPEKDMTCQKSFSLEINDNKKSKSESLESLNKSINIGEKRSIDNLTQNELAKLEGYTIAAVLPELTVNESNQYDFEIELDENIQSGKKLFYFAFSDKESDDDEISEFYNISGEEIENVPDEKIITVSAWFNSGVIYRPVIAVKSDTFTF